MAAPRFEFLVEVAPGQGGASPVWRNAACDPVLPLATSYEGCCTTLETWQRSVLGWPNRRFLGERTTGADGSPGPYTFQTYAEVDEEVRALARALVAQGLEHGSRIGIYGSNSPPWVKAMLASSVFGGVCVPLYDSLGPGAAAYILRHSGMQAVFVQDSKLPALSAALQEQQPEGAQDVPPPQLQLAVVWGAILEAEDAARLELESYGVRTHMFDALINAHWQEQGAPGPRDLAAIMYTSGTTGVPKGVMLSHRALVATVASQLTFLRDPLGRAHLAALEQARNADPGTRLRLAKEWRAAEAEAARWPQFQPGDAHLSYLPLAHIYERAFVEAAIAVGAAVGCWQGDVDTLQSDAAALRPAAFIGVPRVWERVARSVHAKLAARSPVTRWLFAALYRLKLACLRSSSPAAACWLPDVLAMRKVRAALGGRVKLAISGAAPLPLQLEEFMRVTMCCHAGQGYGLTETCSATAVAVPGRWDMVGSVGPIQTCADMRLAPVSDMGYDPTTPGLAPRGELQLRGPCLFDGYYKDPAATAEVLSPDGWFSTGDVVELLHSGALKIIDRKKNLIKLAQGEYVPVEAVETALKQAGGGGGGLLEALWVHGEPGQRRLVAVAIPNRPALLSWWRAQRTDLAPWGDEDVQWTAACASPDASRMVLDALQQQADHLQLPKFQRPAAVHLEPDLALWSPEGGLLTATFKLRRTVLRTHYMEHIARMYADLDAQQA